MKAILFFLGAAICSGSLGAQEFAGYRSGNFTGVNAVFFNPANIADSRYRFAFNLFSASTMAGNNKASFNTKTIAGSFDTDNVKNKLLSSGPGASSGMVSVNLHGPSLMITTGKKSAIALTSRFRTMANMIDIDGQLASQIINDVNDDVSFPYTITSNENMRLAVTAWSEFGLSYARTFLDNGAHFLKAGVSVKYLAGVANGYLNINQLNASINDDGSENPYLQNTTGRIGAGYAGVSLSDVESPKSLKINSTGFGGDIGVVYEFRPGHAGYKTAEGSWMRDRNKYKLKVGLALLDIGRINFKRDQNRSGNYELHITGHERLYLSEFENLELENYNAYFQSRPQYFTPAVDDISKQVFALPATLQLDVDYRLYRGFYASLAAQVPFTGTSVANNRYYSNFTLTPRYEGKFLGLYVPVNYNSLTHFNAGVSLRLGPAFIGSGSVLSAVLGQSKQADIHAGVHFAGLYAKNKAAKAKK